MDFVGDLRRVRGMDDDSLTLISDLLVQAGMLMEDISVDAIRILPAAFVDRHKRIDEIAYGGAAVGALTLAAWCLSQRARSSEI